jgi:hypothetical protein
LPEIDHLSYLVGLKAGRGARGQALQNPLPSPSSLTSHRHRPPVDERHPAETLTPAPPSSDAMPAPHAALAIAMATVGIPVWPASHRPPPTLSPRRQTPLDTLDQFPKLTQPESYRAHHPVHAVLTRRRSPERPERRYAPVHTHTLGSRASHHRARRPAQGAKPPSPCPLTDRTDLGKPGFRRAQTEPETPSTGPLRHRHLHPYT